jgi:thioredoxin reductase (NADPH)
VQAQKFGCNISIPHSAKSIQHCGTYFTVCASNGKVIKTKAIMTATGAEYQQLPIENVKSTKETAFMLRLHP